MTACDKAHGRGNRRAIASSRRARARYLRRELHRHAPWLRVTIAYDDLVQNGHGVIQNRRAVIQDGRAVIQEEHEGHDRVR